MLYVSVGCLLAAVIILLRETAEYEFIPEFYGIIIGAATIIILWLASLRLAYLMDSAQNWLNPMYGLGLWYLLHFGVMAVYNYNNPPSDLLPPQPIPGMILSGTWAAVLGYFSLLAGFFVFSPRRLVPQTPAVQLEWLTASFEQKWPRRTLLLVCLLCGWPNRLYLFLTGNYHFGGVVDVIDAGNPFAATLGLLDSFSSIAIIIAAVGCWKKREPLERILLVAILMAEVAWGLLAGSKQGAFMPLVIAFAAWYGLRQGERVYGRWIYACSLVLLIVIAFPFFNSYRNTGARVDDPLAAWSQILSDSQNGSGLLTEGADAAAKRIGGIVPLSLVIQYTPDVWEFQQGSTFSAAIFSPIPRFIWQGKPAAFDKVAFGQQYFLTSVDNFTTATSPTVVGELYLNFGWYGIILGMAIYGCILRLTWEWYRNTGQSSGPLLILLLAWFNLLMIDGLFSDSIGSLPRQLVIILIVFRLISRFVLPSGGRVRRQGDLVPRSRGLLARR